MGHLDSSMPAMRSRSAAPAFPGFDLHFKHPEPWVTHTFLIKDPNWIFMFAERALTKSVGSGAKQEEKDLCCSGSFSLPPHPHPAFPLKVHSWGGGGCGLCVANKILAALASKSPGACLCSVESSSLFFGPTDTNPSPGRSGREWGGGGGELG